MILLINFFRRLARRLARSELITILILTFVLVLAGTLTYARLEGWSLLDALYATIITITTVGYGDFTPQTPAGRVFAIFFTFIAIGIAGYAISTLAANLVEAKTQKKIKILRIRRMKRIEDLKDHFILCGADLVGTRIAEEFYLAGAPFTIIEPDEEKLKFALLYSHPDYFRQKVQSLKDIVEIDLSEYENLTAAELGEMLDTPYLLSDPTDDSVLVKAGIDRAAGVIAAMPDERDNLSIVVGARALANRLDNTYLKIMARVEGGRMIRKMYLSGADYVRVPAVSSGLEMAMHMMNPEIGNWWYTLMGINKAEAPRIEQNTAADRPAWTGKSVQELHGSAGVITLAVKRDGSFISPPPADLQVQPDDILITLSKNSNR